MAWVNFPLLFGGLLMGIPILLHLVMRQQPKHLIFPALRFIQQRRETNRRKLQLRHLLLLLLRCLAIAMLAAALARPSAASAYVGNWIIVGILGAMFFIVAILAVLAGVQQRSRALAGGLGGLAIALLIAVIAVTLLTIQRGGSLGIGDREAPVAAVIVVDTSPRMEFEQANATRLEEAKEMAEWVVGQLPPDSEIDVASSTGEVIESYDRASAERNIKILKTSVAPEPLTKTLLRAVEKLAESDKSRKEIYVFTDMTRGAWQLEDSQELRSQLDENANVTLYIIDVGARDAQNFALGQLKLSAEVLPVRGDLQVETEVTRLGPAGERTVELLLEKPDLRRPVRIDGKTLGPERTWTRTTHCQVPENSSQSVRFSLGRLDAGTHQGHVEIQGQDGLPIDDRRYFTVEVKQAWPVLVVAPKGVPDKFLVEALAPATIRETGGARFECIRVAQENLGNEDFDDYAAVCLLDPKPLTPPLWDKLQKYVERGGGLAICLGNNAAQNNRAIKSFNDEPAQQLLAGELTTVWRSGAGDVFLRPRNTSHPVLAEFRSIATSVPWNEFPVHKHFGLIPQDDVDVIVTYTNNMPALIEKRVGAGRVFTFTTPISDPARPDGRKRWNDLPLGRAWPYFVLVNELFSYLVEQGNVSLNYLAGQTAVLPNNPDVDPESYQLFRPNDEPPRDVFPQGGQLRYKFTNAVGPYRLKGLRHDQPMVRGFSVNLPPAASDLTPIDQEELDGILGADRYLFARNRAEINRDQGEARIGREFFPFLICLVALILGLENVLSNRFYRQQP